MAALRKASAYSRKKVRPYTRKSKSKNKAYIKAIPPIKIVKFNMGNVKAYNEGKHSYVVRLIADEKIQIRDNALEACRTLISKTLEKNSPGQYYLSIKVYPHHILRENKIAAGAGADRLSSGMRHSFGVTTGRAAIVNAGKDVFFISCENDRVARIARDALIPIKAKIPGRNKIVFGRIALVPKVEKVKVLGFMNL